MGCSAGFVNVPRIKGSHNAMLSGMLAAEAAHGGDRPRPRLNTTSWPPTISHWREGEIGKDLVKVRNVKPLWSKFGTLARRRPWRPRHVDELESGFGFSFFGTMKHGKPDAETLKPAKNCKKIDYPKPDGKSISFDKLSSVFLSNTNHEEDQPIHLKVKDDGLQKSSEHDVFAGPSNRYCPAGVYEVG